MDALSLSLSPSHIHTHRHSKKFVTIVKLFTVAVIVGVIHILFTNYLFMIMRQNTISDPPSFLNLNACTHYSFDEYLSTSPSRYVLPRAAFFDSRPRGRHKNATVILASIHRSLIGRHRIKACIVNQQEIRSIKVQPLIANKWIHKIHPECSYNNTMIFCFDVPQHIRNHSKVELIFKDPDSENFVSIETEHSLYIPQRKRRRKFPYNRSSTVLACATVFESPPYFLQWLHFQKSIGVDMVYLNAQESFVNSSVFNDSFLQESIRNGFVTVKVWKDYLGDKVFYHNQAMYYNNCLYRYQGVYEFVMMFDSDDFFFSRLRPAPVREVLRYLFTEDVGSIELEWRRYYDPYRGSFNHTDIEQFVDISPGIPENNIKSIHRLSATIEIRVHAVVEMLDGYTIERADYRIAHVAHIKNPTMGVSHLSKE